MSSASIEEDKVSRGLVVLSSRQKSLGNNIASNHRVGTVLHPPPCFPVAHLHEFLATFPPSCLYIMLINTLYCTSCFAASCAIFISALQNVSPSRRFRYFRPDPQIGRPTCLSRYLLLAYPYFHSYLASCLPVYLPNCLPAYLPICLPAHLHTCLPVFLPYRLSICCLYASLNLYLPAFLPAYLPVYPLTYLLAYLPTYTYLPVYLSTCPPACPPSVLSFL